MCHIIMFVITTSLMVPLIIVLYGILGRDVCEIIKTLKVSKAKDS